MNYPTTSLKMVMLISLTLESQKEESKNYPKQNQSKQLKYSNANLNDRDWYHQRFHHL